MARRKTPEHRAEMEARALRRAERSEHSLPGPKTVRRKPTTTDVSKTKAAHDKRIARNQRRLNEAAAGGWQR